MKPNSLFENTVTALLAGSVVCDIRYSDLFAYLSEPENQNAIEEWLVRIGRSLRLTSNQDGWVACYTDLSGAEAQSAVKEQFSVVANQLEELVDFLRLIMEVTDQRRPIAPGETLSIAKMADRISTAPALENKLRSLTQRKLFKSSAADAPSQLKQILSVMQREGYLVPVNTAGIVFQATGKWSWLYDVMDFVRVHEGIQDAEPDEPQGEQMRLSD